MNEQTKTNHWANYYEIKNIHMDEIEKVKKQNRALELFIASQVGVIIVLATILATMIF
jgi:hypothetical protein